MQEHPYVLLSWPQPPYYIPPPLFSTRQVTLCPEDRADGLGVGQSSIPEGILKCPAKEFDLYEFVQRSDQIEDKKFDLLLVWFSCNEDIPLLNTKKLGCPTVLLVGDTHHGRMPIRRVLDYCALEKFDYIVSVYNRQHLHWFSASGFQNVAWLPCLSSTVVTHEWVEVRENKVAFLGQLGCFHPRRRRLINTLKAAGFPVVARGGTREEGARLFANSLISFNCSLNGDFNLRNLEIISAGGFLLTDRLGFASGFEEYLVPGLYCDVYESDQDLIAKVNFYMGNPELAIEIARRAYKKFFTDWHPKYRIANLFDWIFKGELPDLYTVGSEPRVFTSTLSQNLLDLRLRIYEPVQELHRVQERLRVFVSCSCPTVIAADLLDLPRLELFYMEGGFVDPRALLQQPGVAERVHRLTGEPASWPVFDVAVCTVPDLKRLSQPLKASFAFVLGGDYQLLFTNAEDITKTFYCAKLLIYEGAGYYLYGAAEYQFERTAFNLERCYRPVASLLSDVKTVVDVGAGAGGASSCFRVLHPQAAIHCFEADPLALHLLQQNALELGNCWVHPVGLAGQDCWGVRRLWPEEAQTGWGVEQWLLFREAKTALQALGLEHIDVLRVATSEQAVEVLTSLQAWLKKIKVIYVEFCSEQDRERVDQVLALSHLPYQDQIIGNRGGSLCYLNKACLPDSDPRRHS